jgi:hypothetical protein
MTPKKHIRTLCSLFLLVGLFLPFSSRATPANKQGVEKATRGFIDLLKTKKVDDAFERLGPAMQTGLPKEKLGQIWASLEFQFGTFSGIKGIKTSTQGGHTIVVATCIFAKMPLDAQLVWDSKGKIVSFFVRPSKPSDTPPKARPQTPKGPFPYGVREVSYTNATDNAVFAGTLTFPKNPGPHPAVLLITGSGSQDRDRIGCRTVLEPNRVPDGS